MSGSRFWRGMWSSPYTWLVCLVGFGAMAAFVAWFDPDLAALGVFAGCTLILWALWPVFLRFDPLFMGRFVREPSARLDERAQARLAEREAGLMRLRKNPQARQALAQFGLLREKLHKLNAILRHRLDEGELTYARYLEAAEEVYLSAMDNLEEAALVLMHLSDSDEEHVAQRIKAIEVNGVSSAERAEYEALRQRKALAQTEREKVEHWLTENEKALTVLDKTTQALMNIQTRQGHAGLAARAAIDELQDLAQRTGRYGRDVPPPSRG
jgi:hypothetical protein